MANQNSTPEIKEAMDAAEKEISKNRGWFIALGVVLVIVGFLAIIFPVASSIAMKFLLGWLFLFTGIAHFFHCFSARNWGGFFADLLLGILFLIAGAWLAFFPIAGLLTLTAFLAIVFILQGIFELIMAFQSPPATGRIYILISGLIAIVAGILIWNGLPSTAAWVIGVLAGVNLISSGVSYIMLAMAADG